MVDLSASSDSPVLDALIDIRRRQQQLDGFKAKAEAMKDSVDPEVYGRVMADYEARHAALEHEAQPLKIRAREEYARLRAGAQGIDLRHREARLRKEEIEFRHVVGEISEDEFAEQINGPGRDIAECETELARVNEQKDRFREALTEAELSEPMAGAAPHGLVLRPLAEQQAAAVAAPEPAHATPAAPAAFSMPDVTLPGPVGDSFDAEMTMLGEAASTTDAEGTVLALLDDTGHDSHATGQTMLVPEATLVADEGGPSPQQFTLTGVNPIGRAPDNHIRLVRPGVSRHHATVIAHPGGYTLRDLGSQNGTFLNGERVTEAPLAPGDRIWVGDVELVYHVDQSA
jgi:hypothetical protein